MNAFIRLLYAALVAVAVIVFTSVGVNSVYPGPTMPEYPTLSYGTADPSKDKEYQKQQQEFDAKLKEHDKASKEHNNTVSMILLPLAVVFVIGGLWYMRRSEVIGEGLALGGVGTSLYAVIVANMADNRTTQLLAVSILLVSALALVQSRFSEPAPKKKQKKS